MKKIILGLASLLMPAMLKAQLPNPSTRALGMGEAYTSMARGYESVFWNPAMLATEGNPDFSISLPHADLEFDSNIYSFSDFRRYANHYLSSADKQTLMNKLAPDSSLTVSTKFNASLFGFSAGNFAFEIGTSGQGDLSVNSDAMQLLLYGNAGQTGPGQFFTANGSKGHAWAATTAAASFALPFYLQKNVLSVGITGKYTIGHFIGSAEDLGSRINANPSFSATEEAQTVYTSYGGNCTSINFLKGGNCGGKAGAGIGADLGAVLQMPDKEVTISAVIVNAINSMRWDKNRLIYERTDCETARNSSGDFVKTCTDSTKLTTQSAINADSQARDFQSYLMENSGFSRLIRLGFAVKKGNLSIGNAMQLRLSNGLDEQPAALISAGLEYNILGFLPIRVGSSWDFNNRKTISVGAGLQVKGVSIDAAIESISESDYSGIKLGVGAGLIW